MKLKYYLRGLGIGIIVTAVLLHVSNASPAKEPIETVVQQQTTETLASINNENNEEQIGEAAFPDTEKEKKEEPEQSTQEPADASQPEESTEATKEETESPTQTVEDSQETPGESIEPEEVAETAEFQTTQEDMFTTPEQAAELVEISIYKGDDSGTVARKLYNAGLVDNATQFDAYLMQHGYDKKISVGIVKIPVGATWLEIAEKLAGR